MSIDVAACCSVLQYIAVCRSVLQFVAACCNALQCVAVCCSVLQCVAMNVDAYTVSHKMQSYIISLCDYGIQTVSLALLKGNHAWLHRMSLPKDMTGAVRLIEITHVTPYKRVIQTHYTHVTHVTPYKHVMAHISMSLTVPFMSVTCVARSLVHFSKQFLGRLRSL